MNIRKTIKAGFSKLLSPRKMTDEEFAEAIQIEGEDTIVTPDSHIVIDGDSAWVRTWTRIETMNELEAA